MDNELFELCKEVYEKTGWDDKDELFHYQERIGGDGSTMIDVMYEDWGVCPLYTSDYLLEKLPKYLTVKKVEYLLVLIPFPDGWIADYYRRYRPLSDFDSSDRLSWLHNAENAKLCEADTPLKALLKLVLALHEAKEL